MQIERAVEASRRARAGRKMCVAEESASAHSWTGPAVPHLQAVHFGMPRVHGQPCHQRMSICNTSESLADRDQRLRLCTLRSPCVAWNSGSSGTSSRCQEAHILRILRNLSMSSLHQIARVRAMCQRKLSCEKSTGMDRSYGAVSSGMNSMAAGHRPQPSTRWTMAA